VYADKFVAGKDYSVLSAQTISKLNVTPAPKGKISVIEFFNYGCPACAYAEPEVEKWLKTKPDDVDFQRMPVAFEQGWDTYAKAYYIAKHLGIEAKITPVLFVAIHGKNDRQYHDLSSTDAMINFFVQQGVKKSVAENAFSSASAATLDLQIKQNLQTMQAYQVFGTPTFVVANKYTVGLQQAKSTARFVEILRYLISKAKQ
jgi:thiol:disulfide interchange protein DsbA